MTRADSNRDRSVRSTTSRPRTLTAVALLGANLLVLALAAHLLQDGRWDVGGDAGSLAWILAGFALLSLLGAAAVTGVLDRAVREGARTRVYLRYASDGIHVLDERGNVVEASDEFCRMLGYRRDEVIGMNLTRWDARWSADELLGERLPAKLKEDTASTFETVHRRKDGSLFEVEVSVVAIKMGGRRYLYASSRDIGDKKRQQQALLDSEARLRESEERYRLLLNTCPVGILHYDRELVATYANERFEQIMQVPKGHMLGLDCKALEDQSVVPAMRRAIGGEPARYEGPYFTTYGHAELWISMSCAPVVDRDGAILGGITIIEDITARKHIEEAERRQRASLARLNEIAALSHLPLVDQLRQALALGAEHLGLDFGIVSHVEDARYTVVAHVSPAGTLHDGQTFPVGLTCCDIPLRHGELVAIADMGSSPHRRHPCYAAFKLEAYIGTPVTVGNTVYGTVAFSSPQPRHRPFDRGDEEFVRLLARWVGSALDRDLAHRRLSASEARLKAIIDNEPECVKVVDAGGTVLQINHAGLEMLEADSLEAVNAHGLLNFIAAEDRPAFTALAEQIMRGERGILEFRVEGKRGARRWVESHAAPLRDERGQIVALLAITRDVTLLREQQRRLEHLAHYEPLTGLPNRTLLAERMAQALAQARRGGTRVAVCYLDLDGFKAINDAHGHEAGDALLVDVAHRLKGAVRAGDTVSRLGGDEFVLLLGVGGASECGQAATRLLEVIANAASAGERRVSGSLGIALYPDHGGDADTLLRHADQAMYLAKQAGKNRYRMFEAAA